MRCVLDTNLLVSGIISAGTPRRLLRGALAGEFPLVTSEILLAELMRVLGRGMFSARLGDLKLANVSGIPIVTASEAIQRLDLESRQ